MPAAVEENPPVHTTPAHPIHPRRAQAVAAVCSHTWDGQAAGCSWVKTLDDQSMFTLQSL
jgi:hypothetical protein